MNGVGIESNADIASGNESETSNLFDSDIKNELVELANKVTEAFANQIEFADSCLNDSSAFLQQTSLTPVLSSSAVGAREEPSVGYESLSEAKQRLANDEKKKRVELWQNENNFDSNENSSNESEFKMPEVDWENLEAKLKQAQQEISKQVIS